MRRTRSRQPIPGSAIGIFAAALGRATAASADIPPSPPGSIASVASRAPFLLPLLLLVVAVALLAVAVLRERRKASVPGESGEGCGKLVSAAFVFFVLCVLLALPNFLNVRVKSRFSEAKSNLGAIRSTEVAYFAEWNLYVGGQIPTPVANRRGNREKVPWEKDTRFSLLGFASEGNVLCSYSLEGPDWPAEGFTARAACDYDHDGQLAIYTITSANNEITRSGAPF